MGNFKQLDAQQLQGNLFDMIGRQWALLTAKDGQKLNTMTVSWGGTGILWNKPVAFIFVRPQRYTEQLLQNAASFSLSFLPEQNRDILKFCGANSGKDIDKIEKCGLLPVFEGQCAYFEQAECVFLCTKLYKQRLDPACILDPAIENNYPGKDYHFMYIGEIEKILVK